MTNRDRKYGMRKAPGIKKENRKKTQPQYIPVSEHVSFRTKGLCSKRWNSLKSVTVVTNL